MNLPSIYDYTSFANYFSEYLRVWKSQDERVSYRWLCRKLDIKSPAFLHMVAKGERLPADGMVQKICLVFELSETESEYCRAFVGFEKSRKVAEKKTYLERMQLFGLKNKQIKLEMRQFELISNWHNFAIMDMTYLVDFQSDPSWISKRLGNKVTPEEVAFSIELLLELGLLSLSEDGKLRKSNDSIATLANIPSMAIKGFHSKMLELANEALYSQSVDERYFSGSTLSFEKNKLPEVKQLIAEFRTRLTQLVHSEQSDEVYHLAFQFFRLTD